MKKTILILSSLLLFCASAFAASDLTFNSSGIPTSLVLDDTDMLGSTANAGFFLTLPDGSTVQLNTLTQSGDEITVSRSGGTETFTFILKSYDHHVAMHLIDVEGLEEPIVDYSLQLKLFSPNRLEIQPYTINDLMSSNASNYYVYLNWPYLWSRPRADGSMGSVVLYNRTLSGSKMDEALAEIWATQAAEGHMVKPKVDSWTENDIMAWIDLYVETFGKLSVISVHPEDDAENLYEMINKYVIPNKPTRVFMFQNSWGINGDYSTPRPEIFPNGETDLRRYIDYLDANGIMIHLKHLTPQVLPTIKGDYINLTSVDDRIMAWSTGTIVGNISSTDTEITFHGTVNTGFEEWETIRFWQTVYFRIGNEIILAETLTNPSEGVWQLSGCTRGQKTTTAVAHSDGEAMLGYASAWGNLNYQEDFDTPNSLGEAIIGEYGEFMNRMNDKHIHFDGTGVNTPPWYMREYTDYAYSKYEYPTTGSTVGQGLLDAHFEKYFSKVQEIAGMLNYYPVRIGPRLHQTGRDYIETATSKLEYGFDIMDCIRLGSRRIEMQGGFSSSKLMLSRLEANGLTDYAFELFNYWKELAPVITDADVNYMNSFLTEKVGTHYRGPDVVMLSKDNDGKYIFTPHRVMRQTSGTDDLFRVSQEWGAIALWHNISTGTTLELENPYAQQQMQVMMWVDEFTTALKDPVFTVNGSGTLSVTGTVEPMEYMNYTGGNTVSVYDENWNFQRTLPAVANNFIANNGTVSVKTESGSGSSSDVRVQFITLGTAYDLTTNAVLEAMENTGISVTGVEVSPSEATIETEAMSLQQLFVNISPADAENKGVVWSSSDETKATVNKDGIVTAIGGGYVTITATTVDGGFTDNCLIYVDAPARNLALDGAASQSSTDYGGVAANAIDGNTNGVFNKGSVTHTEAEDNPWWQVDLGDDYVLVILIFMAELTIAVLTNYPIIHFM